MRPPRDSPDKWLRKDDTMTPTTMGATGDPMKAMMHSDPTAITSCEGCATMDGRIRRRDSAKHDPRVGGIGHSAGSMQGRAS